MPCPRCQHENPPQAKFCLDCGARLVQPCGNCGTELPPGARFCLECGQPVGSAPAARARFTSPESYTPEHLAEKILTSRSALEGERKQVTVLLADLKGSMELLADRDPEDARQILDPVLAHMMDAVHRYEGTVNQVMGDGIMALFGAPIAHEDHAVRACYAALQMQQSINRYADEARRAHGVTVQIRVGLNSGEVVVRAIGNDLRMDYTAVGETTHLAARMEQAARPGTVLMAPATLDLVEGLVAVKSLGPVPVKGRREPVEVYELSGIGPARTRLQAAARRGLTRFVGRDAEIEVLRRSFEHAGAGHGQAVGIVGDAGVGKSRLVWEFTRSPRTHGWLVLEGGSVSYGRATPYLPVIELLKAYLRIQERDDPREIRERVAGKLLALDRTLEPLVTPLLALLDVPVDDAAWAALDPPQRRQRILEGVKRLLLREGQVQPLLLVFEDLHWIDSESQALLDGLVESLPTARVLLLVSYRPEYQHAWGSKTYYTQLRIDPLPPESAEVLLTALLGRDATLEPLKRVLIERTEGRPFFLEESVRTLVETKVLGGDRGAYRLTKAPPQAEGRPEAWQIPPTVQAILAARIDRLPPEDKRLLQAASVIGKDVPFTLLQAITDGPENSLRRGLTHLQAAEFLYETSLFPDLEYTFKHALTHEVAYGSVLQDRRRALHARIVEALEALYPDRLAEQVERLAHHAFRGEAWEKAVTYLQQAGAKALARSAYREAVTGFEQALAALRPLPDSRQKIERAIDLRLDLRQSLFPLNELATVWRYLQEAEGLARTLDDPRRLGWVSVYLSGHHMYTGGHATEVRTLAQTVEAIAERLGDVPLRIAAQYYLAAASQLSGDYRGTEQVCRRLMESLHGEPTRERFGLATLPAMYSRGLLARALAERGVFDEGDAQGQEAIRIAEGLDHPFSVVVGCLNLAHLKSVKGELSQAAGLLERAVAQCREWNITNQTPLALASLGHVYAWSGRTGEGVSCLQQAVTAYESAGIGYYHSLSVEQLGEAYLLADQVENAHACADRAVMLARRRGERGHEAWVLRLLGDIASHRDRIDVATAAAHYGAAMTLASELGMRPLAAHCHLGLGTLYHRAGDRPKAQDHLTTATAMYREMEMRFWSERADAALGPLGSDASRTAGP
jgi:class 3 adenylate cyclase/tetratricopeptide (TPR) repeat protein